MENYVKALLYAYPFIERAKESYTQHVRSKALLSCDGRMATEKLVEYLVEEILRKRRLEWLEQRINWVLEELSERERMLIEICFFGERKKLPILKEMLKNSGYVKRFGPIATKMFRLRTFRKTANLMEKHGITEKRFHNFLKHIDVIEFIYERMKEKEIGCGKDG